MIALSSAMGDKPKTTTVEGPRNTLGYVMPKDASPLEAVRAYRAELEKLGPVKVLFQGVNAGGAAGAGQRH